jgi:hypothetical protein
MILDRKVAHSLVHSLASTGTAQGAGLSVSGWALTTTKLHFWER